MTCDAIHDSKNIESFFCNFLVCEWNQNDGKIFSGEFIFAFEKNSMESLWNPSNDMGFSTKNY